MLYNPQAHACIRVLASHKSTFVFLFCFLPQWKRKKGDIKRKMTLPEHEINDSFRAVTRINICWMNVVVWGSRASLTAQSQDRTEEKRKINSCAALIDDATTLRPLFFIKWWTYKRGHPHTPPPHPSSSQAAPRRLTERALACFLIKKAKFNNLIKTCHLGLRRIDRGAVHLCRSAAFHLLGNFAWRPLVTEKISFQQIYFIYYSGSV